MSESNPSSGSQLLDNDVVTNWLNERNQLLIQYFRLSGKKDAAHLPAQDQIKQFCGLLIDYVSAGHFEVYEKIINEDNSETNNSVAMLDELYPEISKTTEIVVDFNDKYSQKSETAMFQQLDNDLSTLGEAIAKRVELEDNLIETLSTH